MTEVQGTIRWHDAAEEIRDEQRTRGDLDPRTVDALAAHLDRLDSTTQSHQELRLRRMTWTREKAIAAMLQPLQEHPSEWPEDYRSAFLMANLVDTLDLLRAQLVNWIDGDEAPIIRMGR